MTGNRLENETSPYLLQHKDNPVDWYPWGEEALTTARRDDKPIMLSVGYAACHWCHVMAHESFEDAATAEVMNELFVNIKVDREERPDLDSIYQNALALLGEQGGWPLTMFLTPDAKPFWGGTYFPNETRFGRPAFTDLLKHIHKIYRENPDKVEKNVTALGEALEQLSRGAPGDGVMPEDLDRIAARLASEVDRQNGGIGGAPKFPHVPLFELLWRAWCRSSDTAARDAVLLTLDRMSEGGIYDHLGGGYARYATDNRWLVPHFEKMLYDNAQMIEILTQAWQGARKPLYEARVRETVGWVLREMQIEEGGFASTLDADSEGVEGKFYVWGEEEIDRLLGKDADHFKEAYDVSPGGNWEGKTILNRPAGLEPGGAIGDPVLEKCRRILFEAREKRIHPGFDDKVLADWNGMMIAALVLAGRVFDMPEWLTAARRAFDFVAGTMTTASGRETVLRHAWRAGRLNQPATLDDYANMCRAALALFEASGEARYLDQCRDWIAILDAHFRDPADGAYFFTADDTENLIVRTKSAADQAVPSGNGILVGVFARLFYLTGDNDAFERATAIIHAFTGDLARNFIPLGTLLNNAEFLENAAQIVIVAPPGSDADAAALARAAWQAPSPNRVLLALDEGTPLPPGHPATGKGARDGSATAYLCEGPVCSEPVTTPAALEALLSGPGPAGPTTG